MPSMRCSNASSHARGRSSSKSIFSAPPCRYFNQAKPQRPFRAVRLHDHPAAQLGHPFGLGRIAHEALDALRNEQPAVMQALGLALPAHQNRCMKPKAAIRVCVAYFHRRWLGKLLRAQQTLHQAIIEACGSDGQRCVLLCADRGPGIPQIALRLLRHVNT